MGYKSRNRERKDKELGDRSRKTQKTRKRETDQGRGRTNKEMEDRTTNRENVTEVGDRSRHREKR